MSAVPKLKELWARHKDQGLVLIGVHSTMGGEKMAAFVKDNGITWPVCIDQDKATQTAFRSDSFPDYHVIDREGVLRVCDLANGELERAIKHFLAVPAPKAKGGDAEPEATPATPKPPPSAAAVLEAGLKEAKATKRRVLVHLGAPW